MQRLVYECGEGHAALAVQQPHFTHHMTVGGFACTCSLYSNILLHTTWHGCGKGIG